MLTNLPGHLDEYFLKFAFMDNSIIIYHGKLAKSAWKDEDSDNIRHIVLQDKDPTALYRKFMDYMKEVNIFMAEEGRFNMLGQKGATIKSHGLTFRRSAL